MAGRTHQNPLEQALGQFATPETRDDALRVSHAALSTAMVLTATSNISVEKKGALAEAYGEAIKLIEKMMGAAHSPYIHATKTVFAPGRGAIPRPNQQ